MNWSRWFVGAVLVSLVFGASFWSKRPAIAFHSLSEVKARLHRSGYHCTTDSLNGAVSNGFLISREILEPLDVCGLCKVGAMGDAWKGKIWVTHSPDQWQLHGIPDDAGTRVWGDIIAFGDHDLLAEIDEALISPEAAE